MVFTFYKKLGYLRMHYNPKDVRKIHTIMKNNNIPWTLYIIFIFNKPTYGFVHSPLVAQNGKRIALQFAYLTSYKYEH